MNSAAVFGVVFTYSAMHEQEGMIQLSAAAKCPKKDILPQGQYWIEYLYLLLATPPYMAAANFVVITNGGGCALTGTADIDQ